MGVHPPGTRLNKYFLFLLQTKTMWVLACKNSHFFSLLTVWDASPGVACVGSFSVWFQSKETPRNGIFGFGRVRNETSQKKKVGEGEGRKRLQTNPSILKTCIRQRTQHLIGSASRTMWTSVDRRFVSYWEDSMVRDTYINFQWLLFILVS